MPIVRLSTSIRTAPLGETLARARAIARTLGISRVTDITHLDRVGLPVFASIRPDASIGSLCVNAGKGLRAAEARVGAFMEAIEFAYAEYNRSGLPVVPVPAREIYEGPERPDSILDFCPRMQLEIPLDVPIPSVEASDVQTGRPYWVPAELVFLPYVSDRGSMNYFGPNSNGLASGNTVVEATVHALAEVIERDIGSFNWLDDRSALLDLSSLPVSISRLEGSVTRAGLELYVRYAPNPFEIAFFNATIADPGECDPVFVNGGQGCHVSAEIAVTRAICEAVQSRLSFIHGGRDDLNATYARYENLSSEQRSLCARRIVENAARNPPTIRFDDVPNADPGADVDSALQLLIDRVQRACDTRVLRVVYTPPGAPLHVVRVLVPGLEFFSHNSPRVGRRLRDYVKQLG